MGLGRARSIALIGLTGHVVDVECAVTSSLPGFSLVGLPDASLGEARERVRVAVTSCGFTFPAQKITVNLSPASLPKAGSALDLAVAASVLAAAGHLPDTERLPGMALLGELALDGSVRPVRGVLPAVLAAARAGLDTVVVPRVNAEEASLIPGVRVIAVHHLAQVIDRFGGRAAIPLHEREEVLGVREASAGPAPVPDLAEVVGQDEARHALEVAAAGGHHLSMVGAPGAGKSMLAERLPGLLPDLDDDAALEVTSIASLAGTYLPGSGLVRRPPFEAPHHSATAVAIVGGGAGIARPGAISRAHRGVLFLDEAPEFSVRVLDTLRQPLERGEVVLHRAKGAARYPARIQLVLAANPCPCGYGYGMGERCTCKSGARRQYSARLSGPLRDRIDISTTLTPLTRAGLALASEPEPTAVVAARVAAARERQRRRWARHPWTTNAEVSGSWLRSEEGGIDAKSRTQLLTAMDQGTLSMRGVDRCLRLAWTLADLTEKDRPSAEDVAAAMHLRGGENND